MPLLPPVVVGTSTAWLVVSDRATLEVVDWLVRDDPAGSEEQLASLARREPALLLWSLWHAASDRAAPEIRSVAQLCCWLGPRFRGLFAAPIREVPHSAAANHAVPEGAGPADQPHRLACRAVELAPAAAAAEAELLALVLTALDGSALLAGSDHDSGAGPTVSNLRHGLPGWLADALARLDNAASADADSDAVRAVAAALAETGCGAGRAGNRSLSPPAAADDLLLRLAGTLARLDQLQHNFAAVLQREKLESMAELAAGAGHEMNNPLAVISGRVQLCLQGESDPQRRRALALINSQALRVHEMIADLMLFARPPRPHCAPCDLSDLVDQVVAGRQAEAQLRGVSLLRTGHRQPLPAMVDATQWTLALRALIDNALFAVAEGGRVELSARRCDWASDAAAPAGSVAEITVADDGPGIPDHVRRHLFDPFYSGREAGRGLGMGLAKCWRIATNHGATIDVDSAPGRGATIIVRIPLSESPEPRHA